MLSKWWAIKATVSRPFLITNYLTDLPSSTNPNQIDGCCRSSISRTIESNSTRLHVHQVSQKLITPDNLSTYLSRG